MDICRLMTVYSLINETSSVAVWLSVCLAGGLDEWMDESMKEWMCECMVTWMDGG